MSEHELRRTVLNEKARQAGGKMVDFHGWELPIEFSGIVKEHEAVRKSAGIFDVSHMGQVFVTGPDAFNLLQFLNANDIGKTSPGKGVYSHLPNERGGLVDDVICFCLGKERYLVVVNAATADKDFAWIKKHAKGMSVAVENKSDEYSILAVQGPNVPLMMETFAPEALPLPRFGIVEKDIHGYHCFISRTGYTGEDGFEITCPNALAPQLWDEMMELGKPYNIIPCGLGARDTLRLEAGYLLYGEDVDDDHTTYEANYGWVVALNKGHFMGRDVLMEQKMDGVKRKLTGIVLIDRGIPRKGCKIFHEGKEVGEFNSATFSPTLKKGIGVGYVTPPLKPGTQVEVEIRGRKVKAEVVRTPFHKGGAFSKTLYTGKH